MCLQTFSWAGSTVLAFAWHVPCHAVAPSMAHHVLSVLMHTILTSFIAGAGGTGDAACHLCLPPAAARRCSAWSEQQHASLQQCRAVVSSQSQSHAPGSAHGQHPAGCTLPCAPACQSYSLSPHTTPDSQRPLCPRPSMPLLLSQEGSWQQ